MVSYGDERPNWVKPNDTFFAMFHNKCTNRVIWLLRTLPTIAPTKAEKPISVLEFFLSIDDENFWEVMDRCPECTTYILFNAHRRHWQKKARQLANMANQYDDLDVDWLIKSSLGNQPGLSGNKKLLRRRHAKVPLLKLSRPKRTKFIIQRNKIRFASHMFN